MPQLKSEEKLIEASIALRELMTQNIVDVPADMSTLDHVKVVYAAAVEILITSVAALHAVYGPEAGKMSAEAASRMVLNYAESRKEAIARYHDTINSAVNSVSQN